MSTRQISRSFGRLGPLLIATLVAACNPNGTMTRPSGPVTPTAPGKADLILRGGVIHTMDPAHPTATAVALAGTQIVAVGTDAEITAWAVKGTEVIELHGRSVTPGLVDAHAHLYGLGVDLENVSVRALTSEAEVVRVVTEAAKARPAGEWLVGRGWDQNKWPGQVFPTKASLDVITDRPVLLRRVDGHASWVNSVALKAAGITAATKDPAGGKIVRDAKGQPTGLLIDNAGDLVDAKMPVATPEQRRRRILAGIEKAIATGITGIHEMGIDDATAEVYRTLDREAPLPLRVYAFLAGDPTKLDRLAQPPEPATPHFVMRGVKFFADGALGSRGARLMTDYEDDGGNRGLWVTEPEQLTKAVVAATTGGWQVAIHAIGDAAVSSTLDAFAAARVARPGNHRPRIEHAQLVAGADFARMVATNAIASMQPTHATSDMPWAEARVGKNRILGAYAWRTMLDRGIPLASGSDFPVEDVGPLLGIYASVTRQDATGQPAGGWYPAQRMTLDEAIAAFSRGAAYAEGAETTRGVIAVGKAADLTVFDRALAADRTLLETRADLTILDGVVRYRRKGGD
ncbi:MAG: amidohydrolase [Deltaproteobacteria bacterium]|nr:amidohydrolase [Deltaproteobacteria bacterium]